MRLMACIAAFFIICPFVSASPIKEALHEIYATPIPAEIRRNFDQTLHIHDTCPKCHVSVLDGEKFIDLYAKKFLVIDVSPNSFGGVWATIAVEGEQSSAFQLWLYDVDDTEYDVRSIEELPESLDEKLIRQLRTPTYRDYWL